MDLQEIATRVWQDLLARPAGPMGFRFIIQPLVAMALALRDGVRDGQGGRRPYLWTMLGDPEQRVSLFREGLASVAKVLTIALVLDGIYQIVVLKVFYPFETVIVALTLAYIPYLIVRGPTARIVHWWNDRRTPTERLQQ